MRLFPLDSGQTVNRFSCVVFTFVEAWLEPNGPKWESSPNKGENKKYLKPPPRYVCQVQIFSKFRVEDLSKGFLFEICQLYSAEIIDEKLQVSGSRRVGWLEKPNIFVEITRSSGDSPW